MGLDIYFEKRRRDFDFSKLNELNKKNQEKTDKIEELYEGQNVNELTNVVRMLMDGEKVDGISDDLLKRAKEIVSLQEECGAIMDEIEKINPRQEVGYFRKTNLLLPFFGYGDNCTYKEITRKQVVDLIKKCKKVLANHTLAVKLLPTCSGFFFGGTEYNGGYFSSLEDIMKDFSRILEEVDWDTETLEMYCWW